MKLISCTIDNFGKLHDCHCRFDPDLHVTAEENGWGKTTLAAFLLAMFYGLDGDSRRKDSLRSRYRPWNGGICGGRLVFETGAGRFRVERTFGERPRQDTFTLYDERTGLETGRYSADLGREIFGIDRESFCNTVFTSGSAGTMASGDRIKDLYPKAKLGVGEALQCPTLLENGFGAHRIEGIGDKHVPWIHNVKNTDLVVDIDDEDSQKVLRLFNEPVGHEYLRSAGVPEETLNNLELFGISGIANMLCAIKMAKYYELTEHDVVATVMTDSASMYSSRVRELQEEDGEYTREMAAVDFHTHILGEKTDNMLELTYQERKRVHNLKYYTWVEQQGKTSEELQSLWYDTAHTWDSVKADADRVDELIRQFNEDTGLLKKL